MITSLALLKLHSLALWRNDTQHREHAARLALYVTKTALCEKHKADMRLLAAQVNFDVTNYGTALSLCQELQELPELPPLLKVSVGLHTGM